MQPMNMAVVVADALAAGTVVAALFYILRGLRRLPWAARLFASLLLVGSAFGSMAMVLLALGHGGGPRIVAQGPWPAVERAVAVARDYGLTGRDAGRETGSSAGHDVSARVDAPAKAPSASAGADAVAGSDRPEAAHASVSGGASVRGAAEAQSKSDRHAAPSPEPASTASDTPAAVSAVPSTARDNVQAVPPPEPPARTTDSPRSEPRTAALPGADHAAPPPSAASERSPAPAPSAVSDRSRPLVFFATDRAPSAQSAPPSFGSVRAERVSLGTVRLAGAGTKNAAADRSWISRVVGAAADSGASSEGKSADAVAEFGVLDAAGWAAAAGTAAREAKRYPGQALVFVHGYNSSLEQAAALSVDIARDLDFDGLVVAYSWASEGRVASYSHDRDSAIVSAAALRGFLAGELARSGATKVHIVAQGIGAAALLAALGDGRSTSSVTIGQVFLVAPDVEPGRLKRFAEAMKAKTAGITLYAAKSDRALTVARRFHGGAARAGDLMGGEPLLIDGIESVDVSTAASEALGDAGRLNPAVAADMAAVMQAGSRGSVQGSRLHKVAASRGGAYWRWSAQ